MSKPLYIYRGEFVNVETDRTTNLSTQKLYYIDIEDHDTLVDDDAEQVPIGLQLTDDPCRIAWVNNDEDPFPPIIGSECTIQVYTAPGISISTFAYGADDRFKVHIYQVEELSTTTIWRGILSTADCRQEFMPDPNVLTLIATDGLGLLNDIELTDFDDNTPQWEHPIVDFIAYAISKKGWDSNINVIMNVRHEDDDTLNSDSTGAGHFYKAQWLDARTFEDEVGTCHNCYEALEKILKDNCTLFQHLGEMWIRRTDEVEYGHNFYVFTFDSEGNFLSKTEITRELTIGVDLPHAWMNDDAEIALERLFKQVNETFRYTKFLETVCNIDISRGNNPDPAGTTVGEETEGDPECMPYYSESLTGFFTDLDQPPLADGKLKIIYDFGLEQERYLSAEAVTRRHYFKLQAFPVAQGDKLTFSVDTRTDTSVALTTVFPVHILLIANDGSYYVWDYDEASGTNQWVSVIAASGWFLNNWSFNRTGDTSTDWRGISATSHPAPEAGKVYIRLVQASTGFEMWFQNISLEILPFINGSYRAVTGHMHTVAQDASTRNKRDNEVFMNDGPSAAYKGVLLRPQQGASIFSGTVNFASTGFNVAGDQTNIFQRGMNIYIDATTAANDGFFRIENVVYNIIGSTTAVTLNKTMTVVSEAATIYTASFAPANRFYSAHVFPDGPTSDDVVHAFGFLQVFDVWNQFNRVMSRMEGTVDGTDEFPGILHKMFSGDASQQTSNRIFQLLHAEIDLHLCEWGAFLAEVAHSDVAKEYTGHSFKYLTD